MLRNIKLQRYVPSTEQRYDRIRDSSLFTGNKRGFKPKAPLYEIVNAILYKLKRGIQWEFLPVEILFENEVLHYKTVFGHYGKWCELDVWKSCWIELLNANKPHLDLSSGDLDGSHTTALRGGE